MLLSNLNAKASKCLLYFLARDNLCLRTYSGGVIVPIKMAFNVVKDKEDTNKTPVVIMHGLFGSKQNWRRISQDLHNKLGSKVYCADARNHGDSPHDSNHGSIHLAEDLKALIQAEGLSKVMLIGHSMGGRAVMCFSLKYPDLVERSVVVDISPISVPRDFSKMEEIFFAMKNIFVPVDASLAEGRVIVMDQIKNAVDDKETIDFIMLNLRKLKNGAFAWAINVEALHENFKQFQNFMREIDGMKPFQGHVLFVCGKHSNYMDQSHWPAIKEIFPNAEITWLDAGHLVHYDQPVEFVNLVTKFLQR